MIWIKKDYKGNEQTWYSEDEVKHLLDIIKVLREIKEKDV